MSVQKSLIWVFLLFHYTFRFIASHSVGSYLFCLFCLILEFCSFFLKWKRDFLLIEKAKFIVVRKLIFQMKVYSRITNFFSKLFTALKQLQTVSCSNIIGSDKMLLLRHLKLPIGGVVWPFGWTKINFAKALGQENATGDSRLQEGWWLTLLHYDWIRENNALD